MQFVLVNNRMPRGRSACIGCHGQLELGYIRERSSRRVFCSYQCYGTHCKADNKSIGQAGFARRPTAADSSAVYVNWARPTEVH